MTQSIDIVDDLAQPRLGIRRVVEPDGQGLDKLARQPNHTLIFSPHPGPGLHHKPRNIDGQPKEENQRQQRVEPRAQGKLLPHRFVPSSYPFSGPCSQAALTAKRGGYLIEPYSISA